MWGFFWTRINEQGGIGKDEGERESPRPGGQSFLKQNLAVESKCNLSKKGGESETSVSIRGVKKRNDRGRRKRCCLRCET